MEERAWMETPRLWHLAHLEDLGVATLAVQRLGATAPAMLMECVAAAWAVAPD